MKNKIACKHIHYLANFDKDNRPPTDEDNQRFESLSTKTVSELNKHDQKFLVNYFSCIHNFDSSKIHASLKKRIRDYAVYMKYGISKISDSTNGQFPIYAQNGVATESQAIDIVSTVIGRKLVKNEKAISNKFFSGIPDILEKSGRKYTFCLDIKTCIDYYRFLEVKDSEVPEVDYWQMQGYMDIMNLDECTIAYVLTDVHPNIVEYIASGYRTQASSHQIVQNRLSSKIDLLIKSSKFDFLTDSQRCHFVTIKRDKKQMDLVKSRVPHVLKYMEEIYNTI